MAIHPYGYASGGHVPRARWDASVSDSSREVTIAGTPSPPAAPRAGGGRPAGEVPVTLAVDGGALYVLTPDGALRELGTIESDGLVWPDENRVRVALHTNATAEPTAATPATDPLESIDRALNGLCPCGGQPRPPSADLPYGSPYCSYDCVPNYRAVDTISHLDRTAMRWRPDLVTAVPDDDLEGWLPRQEYPASGYAVEVFRRRGTDLLHVRIDDGHRWVGADVALLPGGDFEQRYEEKLRALLAELQNERQVTPRRTPTPPRYAGGNAHLHLRLNAPRSRAVDIVPRHAPWALGEARGEPLAGMRRALLGQLFPDRHDPAVIREQEARHAAREAALEARRNRNTGPPQQPRAPRTINPHRHR